jgi:hypothetical protein
MDNMHRMDDEDRMDKKGQPASGVAHSGECLRLTGHTALFLLRLRRNPLPETSIIPYS